MIPVTKDEARILRKLYPDYPVTRTMVQDSKRHHYFAAEKEELMRAIADTNHKAAEIILQIDRERMLRHQRMTAQGAQYHGRDAKA